MPTKQDEWFKRWNETKDRNDWLFEEYLREMSSIFETYCKNNKGMELTMSIINTVMDTDNNVDNNKIRFLQLYCQRKFFFICWCLLLLCLIVRLWTKTYHYIHSLT